jgi:hypothetical protein
MGDADDDDDDAFQVPSTCGRPSYADPEGSRRCARARRPILGFMPYRIPRQRVRAGLGQPGRLLACPSTRPNPTRPPAHGHGRDGTTSTRPVRATASCIEILAHPEGPSFLPLRIQPCACAIRDGSGDLIDFLLGFSLAVISTQHG